MDSDDNSRFWQFKWHFLIIGAVVLVVIVLGWGTNIFDDIEAVRDQVFLLGSLVFLAALLTMLWRMYGIVDTLRNNSAKMEEATNALEGIREKLMQIDHSTRVSETVKAIVFREEDRQSMRNAVFQKLKQQDFDGAYEIVDEIANHVGHRAFAEELRREVDAYRDATEEERVEAGIAHVETLFRTCKWPQASVEIEALIRAHPNSAKARGMRQQLIDRKNERKKILLAAWDDAVRKQETDRSLDILRELDMYLTPNEGLALQEAAKDIFKTKLHNLGVRFAMAVSDKQWSNALDVGQQIIREFPNSRMSVEIRERLDVLQQNVQTQHDHADVYST